MEITEGILKTNKHTNKKHSTTNFLCNWKAVCFAHDQECSLWSEKQRARTCGAAATVPVPLRPDGEGWTARRRNVDSLNLYIRSVIKFLSCWLTSRKAKSPELVREGLCWFFSPSLLKATRWFNKGCRRTLPLNPCETRFLQLPDELLALGRGQGFCIPYRERGQDSRSMQRPCSSPPPPPPLGLGKGPLPSLEHGEEPAQQEISVMASKHPLLTQFWLWLHDARGSFGHESHLSQSLFFFLTQILFIQTQHSMYLFLCSAYCWALLKYSQNHSTVGKNHVSDDNFSLLLRKFC